MFATTSPDVEVAPLRTPPHLRFAYRSESLEHCRRAARTACLLWITVTPAFVLIDYARFPDVASSFLPIRGIYVAINVLLLLLLGSRLGSTRPRELALATTLVGGLLIFALMRHTGGHASPYANGVGLLILGTALLMPWSPTWSMLATGVIVSSYVGYAWWMGPIDDVRMVVNNTVGFAAAGLIGAVSAVARERLRWREFKNRFAFKQTYLEKCTNEEKLKREVEANRRLIAALEQANQVRTEFVSTMSHELRTPLNVIIGLAEMARDPSFDASERGELLGGVRHAGARMLELVEGTLEVGKLEAGRTALEARSSTVAALWSELRLGCADLIPRPHVALHWDTDLPMGEIRTDPRKLLVILRNLLANALKFTDAGYVRVRFTGSPDEITVIVDDTGVGIRPEDQEIVFEMFRQADGSDTRRFEGCGLGLYIVRQLTQRLGGSVHLRSEPERGSTFSITLPRLPEWSSGGELKAIETRLQAAS